MSDRVPQEHRDTAREKIEQGRKVLVEDYFPEGRRDQFIYRSKKVWIIDCQALSCPLIVRNRQFWNVKSTMTTRRALVGFLVCLRSMVAMASISLVKGRKLEVELQA